MRTVWHLSPEKQLEAGPRLGNLTIILWLMKKQRQRRAGRGSLQPVELMTRPRGLCKPPVLSSTAQPQTGGLLSSLARPSSRRERRHLRRGYQFSGNPV